MNHICTLCGETVPNGIFNQIRHLEVCKKDSPNTCIASYRSQDALRQSILARRKRNESVISLLSMEEQVEYYFIEHLDGIPESVLGVPYVLKSEAQVQRYEKFMNRIWKKYEC